MIEPRRLLLEIFQHALQAVNGRSRVREALRSMPPGFPWQVIAVGKAASAMTLGALDALDHSIAHALVVSKDGHFDVELLRKADVQCLASGHPLPDERSLTAGAEIRRVLGTAPRERRVLFLISGGASSLVESPPAGVTLEDLRAVNRWALAAGIDIAAHNALRRRLSLTKNGRLLSLLAGREAHALLISDVPGDDPAIIGSGIVGAPIVDTLPTGLPRWVEALLERVPPSAPEHDTAIRRQVIATLDQALDAACAAGQLQGLELHRGRNFAGAAAELATRFCHEMDLGDPGLFVWGGESTVRLPDKPGRGGRNQHLALAAARLIASHEELTLLAAGTDGTDGVTTDAGALVDEGTLERGTLDGLDADDCLLRADSGAFLEASGDLLSTGPTGTNVGDLVLGLKRV